MKGISIIWLSETNLTNLNSGEGESNYIDVKKYKKMGLEFPYVSGQAMRYYIKEAIRRNLEEGEYMCVPDDKGETCGEIEKCITCDLFGFMGTIKGETRGTGGANIRVSPVKVSPAMGLLPFDDNSVVDFLTRRHRAEKLEGDIVNVEIGTNIYRCGISIDFLRIGGDEFIDQSTRNIKINYPINETERIHRALKILQALRYLTDYSKQSRLLTDFTPDVICIAFQDIYSHRLQKLFEFVGTGGNNSKTLNIDRFREILQDVKEYSGPIFFGSLSGIIENQNEIQKAFTEIIGDSARVTDPREALKNAIHHLNPK